MADEHAGSVLGCAGHPVVRTPNVDRLASRGTRFANAYTDSPICVPARAAFATGRPVHQTGYWDNAFPYAGAVRSWGHLLQDNGIAVESIGKLHYRSAADDTGFDHQHLPMHVVNGVGDVLGAVRDPLPVRNKCKDLSAKLGPGITDYIRYDQDVTNAACDWLRQRTPQADAPWVLFVSLVCPHFPLVAPPELFDAYRDAAIAQPKPQPDPEHDHPWVQALRECFIYDRFFTPETRRIALASYYALCSFADVNLGRILEGLASAQLAETTRVIYLSDHGDNMGARGLWGKSTLFEEAVAVPMVLAGPDIPVNSTCATPVTLADMYATILDAVGLPWDVPDSASLLRLAQSNPAEDRTVLSQYHAAGAISGAFMLRQGRYKYLHYVGMRPQLFDLEDDPEELVDLAANAAHRSIIGGFERQLVSRLDPEEVDRRAKADQKALVLEHGGRDKVVAQGTFGPTPIPGVEAKYVN